MDVSWKHLAAVSCLTYVVALVAYRLYFHPLAKFPGPKLAAISRWYEAYYDVVCDGQYTLKIAQMHKTYGPIVRISPYELHINEPNFFKQIYRQDGRWDKYDWSISAFGAPTATLHSIDHYHHKYRRAALNSYFSKVNVVKKQDIVERAAAKLCGILSSLRSDVPVNLGNAISAFTRDTATEFLLGQSFNHLDTEGFHGEMATLQQNGGKIWRTTKHVPWYGPLMQSIPMSIIEKSGDQGLLTFLSYVQKMMKITNDIIAEGSSSRAEGEDASPTIVEQMLSSNLPPTEKTFEHLSHEVMTLTSAGMETTAYVLRVTVYHLYKNPSILQALRDELASTGPDQSLEALPYLTAVLKEGLRMSPPIFTRSQRLAPDRDLQLGEWRIPAGTPVAMTYYLMHMDEKVYPEPEQFRPDRWLNETSEKKEERVFEPFSRGTRMCLGMHLAWTELYILIASLVRQFNFDLDAVGPEDVIPVADRFTTGTARQNGFVALVKPYRG